uniref:NADH dehydrogenase subunit 2 n=1 Tax=Conidiobolus chlamydosporus TaxID=1167813 RepID=UPI001D0FE40D|nr:NADH dehydrogenase subunit 2 [Conidiobolus chlamydosporus]QZZ81311.1 NADH dehydrogenase subunit 2 [Conidiobolus chlamydosporus]
MLSITIIIFILGLGFLGNNFHIHRISMIFFFFAALLNLHVSFYSILSSGIALYNGLFLVSPFLLYVETFIFIMAGLSMIILSSNVIKEYSILILLTTFGMTTLISSNDLVSILLGIELQTLALYIIASLYRDSESSTSAGLKYYLLGALSSCFIALGSSIIYGMIGITNLEEIFILINISNSLNLFFPILLISVGLLFKIGAAPFHNWLADVIDGVPTIISTWLAAVSKISIFVLLFVLYNNFFIFLNDQIFLFSIILSFIVGSFVGIVQYRIKRLLAYSSIAHVGFFLLALVINNNIGFSAFLFYLVQYSLTVLNIFIIFVAYGKILNSSNIYSPIETLSQLKGKHIINPLLAFSLAICLFSSAGIPPFIGFFAKFNIFFSALDSGYYFITLVSVLTSIISGYFYIKIIKVLYFHSIPFSNKQAISSDLAFGISLLTFIIVFFFFFPSDILDTINIISFLS